MESLDARMKRYESVPKQMLMRRTPVIMRLDGNAFHTFTKGLPKPFYSGITYAMKMTMKYLCEHISGCVLGYTQSDEITLVICDYQKLTTDAWFNYGVQKMCSIASSFATFAFTKNLREHIVAIKQTSSPDSDEYKITDKLDKRLDGGAFFDCRVFNLQKEEVNNCLVWRQQDAVRNSISALAQSVFSAKELHGLKQADMKAKLLSEKGIDFDKLPLFQQRGRCCVKTLFTDGVHRWTIDDMIPIFSEHSDYVNNRIVF